MADSLRERVIAACSAQPRSAEDYPFSDEVTVFKIAGKMLTLGPATGSVSLKCAPDLAAGCAGMPRSPWATTLIKRHWNTVTLDGSVPEDEL